MTNENTVTTPAINFEVSTTLVRENENYTIHRDEKGKYSRRAKYTELSTFKAETKQDKIWLLNLLENVDEESGLGMKDHVGEIIEIADIIIRPYDSINEDTGEQEYGVLTYLITPERQAYVTSAKAVYFSIKRIMEVFGKPGDDDWENVKVAIGKRKMENGDAIFIKLID